MTDGVGVLERAYEEQERAEQGAVALPPQFISPPFQGGD